MKFESYAAARASAAQPLHGPSAAMWECTKFRLGSSLPSLLLLATLTAGRFHCWVGNGGCKMKICGVQCVTGTYKDQGAWQESYWSTWGSFCPDGVRAP